MRNCTRDEGGPFGFGNQVLISSHRKLLRSRAVVVLCQEGALLERHAVLEMEEGPPRSACRSGPQTAVSCFVPKGHGGERDGQKVW